MNRTKLLLTITFFILNLTISYIAYSATENILTVEDCVNLALKQNPEILSALEDRRSAEAQTTSAKSAVFPKFTAETSYAKVHSYQSAQIGDALGGFAGGFAKIYKNDHPTANLSALSSGTGALTDSIDNYSVKISAQQILYSGSVFAAIEASDYGVKLADKGLAAKINTTVYSVKEAYINVLKADEMYLSVIENKKLIEQLISQTESMISAGLATRADLLKLQLSLKNIEQAVIGSENGAKLARQQLNLILGIPITSSYQLKTVKTSNYEGFSTLNANDLITIAEKQRKELDVLDYQIKLYNTQIAAIASGTQPMVLAMGSYGYQNSEFSFNDSNKDWLVSVAAKWNFIDGGDTQGKIDTTKATISKIQIQKSQLISGIELEINAIMSNINSSIAKIQAALKELELARENVDIAKEKYVNGLGTNLELINAQTSLFTAQTDLINAQYDFELAKAKLYKAIGETEKI